MKWTKYHTIHVEIKDRTAYVQLPGDEPEMQCELLDGETEELFMVRLEGIIRQAFGEKLKSLEIKEMRK